MLGVVAVLLLSPKAGGLFMVFGEVGATAVLVAGVACVAAETSVPTASPLLVAEVLAISLGAGLDAVLRGSSCAQATSTAVLKSAINVVFKLIIRVLLKCGDSTAAVRLTPTPSNHWAKDIPGHEDETRRKQTGAHGMAAVAAPARADTGRRTRAGDRGASEAESFSSVAEQRV